MEELLASVLGRVDAYREHGDVSPLLAREALVEADQLVHAVQAGDGGEMWLRALTAVAWLHWYRALALPGGQGDNEYAYAAQLFDLVGQVDPTLVEDRPEVLSTRAAELLAQARDFSDSTALDQAIDLLRQVVTSVRVQYPFRAGWLANLCVAHRLRYEWLGDIADLDAALAAGREAAGTIKSCAWPGPGTVPER